MSRSASRPTASNRRMLAAAAARSAPPPAAPADPPWIPALERTLAAHGVGLETWRAFPYSNTQTSMQCLADAVRFAYEAGLAAGRASGGEG